MLVKFDRSGTVRTGVKSPDSEAGMTSDLDNNVDLQNTFMHTGCWLTVIMAAGRSAAICRPLQVSERHLKKLVLLVILRCRTLHSVCETNEFKKADFTKHCSYASCFLSVLLRYNSAFVAILLFLQKE